MMEMTRRMVLGAGLATVAGGVAGAAETAAPLSGPDRPKPRVVAHRGASALRPEHTLGAYAKAIADGADSIEPDLVLTRDGVLVARHENNIAETTDVAGRPAFASRRTEKVIDGQRQVGWFTEDMTLAELKELRAVERLAAARPISRGFDGEFQILTMDEIVDFVAAEAAARGRTIGIAPELKHPTYFSTLGLPGEDRLLAVLGGHAYTRRAPVIVQSFETANLRYLRSRIGRSSSIRLSQLVVDLPVPPPDVAAAGGRSTYREMLTPAGLRVVAGYADIISPDTRVVIPLREDGRLGAPGGLVRDAHAVGLEVYCWTFRPENRFLAADFRNAAGQDVRNEVGSIAEIRRYVAAGIDGLFSDDPALARSAVG